MWWKEYEAEQAMRFGGDGKSDAERKIAGVEGITEKLNVCLEFDADTPVVFTRI